MGEIFSHSAKSVETQPPLTAARAVQTYSLLGVSPFSLDKDKALSWAEPLLASRLLRAPQTLLPSTEEALERRLKPSFRRLRRAALAQLTWDGARYCVQYKIDLYDGQIIWVEERGERLSGTGRQADKILATLADIDERKCSEQELIYHASHDPLTGLWNERRLRRGFVFLEAASKAANTSVALLRLRLSNLADINTTYGYEAGDRILKSIAGRLSSGVTAPHMTGRISGSTFVIGLMGCAAADIKPRLDALLTRLSGTPYESPQGVLKAEFTVSSVALSPDHQLDIDTLFSQSALAMERALKLGTTYLAYAAALHGKPKVVSNQETTADDIIAALNDRRLSLAYQPIVDAQTHAVHHYECLLRLKRPDTVNNANNAGDNTVSAGRFIMAAERLGLVHLLDRRALELAAQTLARYPDIHLALNVSAATVKNEQSAADYLEALRGLGPAAPRVTIELTETVALGDPAVASRFSVQARALGCAFSIDDFGSGHTSFQNLMAVEADSIKIDGSFVKDLSLTPHKQTFVRMMVDLAQTFSVKTVAEMVETPEDAKLLKRLGVDYLQGYLFGTPSAAPAGQEA